MKFNTLIIRNFLAIGEATINLSDRGLVLLQGDNRDDTSANSNGAGKSSVVDALCWCLFGVTARGESGDAVVNQKAGNDCYVEVQIVDGFDTYTVTRHRKDKIGKNGLFLQHTTPSSATCTDLTKGTDKLTQAEVERVLGSTYEVFRSSIYAGQDDMPNLPAMTDRNLKALVEEAAGVTLLEQAYEEARRQFRDAETHIEVDKATIANGIVNLRSARDSHNDRITQYDKWEANQREVVLALGEEMERLADTINDRKSKMASSSIASVTASIKEADEKLASVSAELDEERKLNNKVATANKTAGILKSKLIVLKTRHSEAKTKLDEVDHKIGCPCDDCGRPLTADEIAPAKASAAVQVEKIAREFRETRSSAESAIAELKTTADALSLHRASMTDVSETSRHRASLSVTLATLNRQETEYRELLAKYGQLTKQKLESTLTPNPYAAQVEDAREHIDKCEKALNDSVTKCNEAEKEQQIAQIVAKTFSPGGVRGKILDEVTPYLNDQTAKYLSTLSDGNITAHWTTLTRNAKGELKEKFAIEVENGKGGKSFGLLSGGEKRKVQIAAALALQDLVSRRATKPIDLWIGDEVDNALDPAGLERLMTILDEKARERGTVVVVSHADLKDWISQVITIIKEDEVSRIEESVS